MQKLTRAPAETSDGAENLTDLLGQVSKNSTSQIDDLVGDFGRLREKLRTDGERIQREIEEYKRLSEMVMQLTKSISESVEKVRSSADGPKRDQALALPSPRDDLESSRSSWSVAD